MRYAIASVYCLLWHALYGWWHGYEITETHTDDTNELVALFSSDASWYPVKWFWVK